MDDEKPSKGLGLLIGIKPKGGSEAASDEEDDDEDDTAAAQAVLDAIKADDPKALKAALKLCYAEE
jgi:hypothetical protein